MAIRFLALIVAGCLLPAAQLPWTPSRAMAADALFGRPLITEAIDETRLVRLANDVPRAFNAENDRGAIAADFPLEHLHLQLHRSPAQEVAVQAFIDALHDPKSPEYHKWLSAEAFGTRFGAAASDLGAVQRWLAGHGFRVNFVYPSRMVIDFSGTGGLVKAAFHTEVHRLDLNGAAHIANISDPINSSGPPAGGCRHCFTERFQIASKAQSKTIIHRHQNVRRPMLSGDAARSRDHL